MVEALFVPAVKEIRVDLLLIDKLGFDGSSCDEMVIHGFSCNLGDFLELELDVAITL